MQFKVLTKTANIRTINPKLSLLKDTLEIQFEAFPIDLLDQIDINYITQYTKIKEGNYEEL